MEHNWIDQVKETKIDRVCCTHGEKRNAHRILVWKTGRKRKVRRHGRRLGNYIKIHLTKMRFGGINWINLTQGRDQWKVRVNSGKEGRRIFSGEFLRRTELSGVESKASCPTTGAE
jgi:hypothetical protein